MIVDVDITPTIEVCAVDSQMTEENDVDERFNSSLFNVIITRSLHFKVIFFSPFSSARPGITHSL